MIVYNVTVSIDEVVQDDWLEWMRSEHIPAVLATGCFVEARLLRVHAEESGGATYAISYLSPSKETFERYQLSFAPLLQRDHNDRFGNHFAAFRTEMSLIEEFKR